MGKITILEMDYTDARLVRDFLKLMNAYAKDPMGGGKPLSRQEKINMVEGLRKTPNALTFLAYVDDKPAGVANCFIGFATFEGKKLINIHDFAVHPTFRRQGIGEKLLETIQKKARGLDCCRLTLELRTDNLAAQRLYQKFGFENGDPQMWFMVKEFY